MKIRKYGYVIMTALLILFFFLLSVEKYRDRESSEEIVLQADEQPENIESDVIDEQPESIESDAIDEQPENIGSDTVDGQEVSESVKEVILRDHKFPGNMRMYYASEEIPFVDEETFGMILGAYEDVEYSAEFEKGNLEVYEEYKQKFWRLLQNEVPFLNREMGRVIYMKDWKDSRGFAELPYIDKDDYYFFDMNGDGLPELCIESGKTAVFAYDADMDQYILWAWFNGSIVGTRKAVWNPEFDSTICEFFQMDSDGDFELDTLFWAEFSDFFHDDINMVMFPDYADKGKRWEITEEMKQQGVLEESSGQWFFKVTDEQFEELEQPYMEARRLAYERRREERYTYDELFGEYEAE